MTFKGIMENRYTTKVYDSSKKIDKQKIEDLKEILRLCPSSINSQPWRFTFVTDKNTKKHLAEISWHNTERILAADTVVVFSRINDIALFEKQIEERLPERAVNYYKEFIRPQPQGQIEAWFGRQVYLALGVFLSACAAMGIDATPMEGIEPENYDKVLNQKDYATLVAVAIGYRDADDFNQLSKNPKLRRPLADVIEVV